MRILRISYLTAWRSEALRVSLAFLPLAVALLAIDGCTSMACLEWSADKGPCPTREEAFNRFGGQSCVADIVAVDSDAEGDETACCYEVTKRGKGELGCGTDPDIEPPGGTGSGPCVGCATLRGSGAGELCSSSVDIFNNLVSCLCSGACAEACDDGSCSTTSDTPDCEACATDPDSGCGSELSACDNDP